MTDHTDYKTREDGTIDTAYYIQRGRVMRSRALFSALRKLRHPFGGAGRIEGRSSAARRAAIVATARR